jgi:hypothetical protein
MADVATPAAVGADIIVRQPARRYFVLGLLTLIYALNFLDRTIFIIVASRTRCRARRQFSSAGRRPHGVGKAWKAPPPGSSARGVRWPRPFRRPMKPF